MKKILIIVPDGGMLFESAGIADILMQANRLHPEGARSATIDGLSTLVIGGNMVKILAWYDNEWGFSNRLVDLALMMAKRES